MPLGQAERVPHGVEHDSDVAEAPREGRRVLER